MSKFTAKSVPDPTLVPMILNPSTAVQVKPTSTVEFERVIVDCVFPNWFAPPPIVTAYVAHLVWLSLQRLTKKPVARFSENVFAVSFKSSRTPREIVVVEFPDPK